MLAPTPSQWQAILPTDAHLLVHAGAGTGKTATVVLKILYELGVELDGRQNPHPIALGQIAAITYTIQAAADLKRKLRQALFEAGRNEEAYEVDVARIGTIHAFTHDILREFALRAGRPFPTNVVDENEAAALLADAVRDTVLSAIEADGADGPGALLTDWSVHEVEGLVAKLVGQSDRLTLLAGRRDELERSEQTLIDLALRTLDTVQARLHARAAVDFDRMVVWTRDMVRDQEGVRRALRHRLKLLIVDEFQDVDPPQKDLAYLLGDPEGGDRSTRLLLVGDPKQSIYRFRRADVGVWHAVQRDFQERELGKVVRLDDSFRSVPQILSFVDCTVGKILSSGESRQDFEVEYHPIVATRAADPAARAVEVHLVKPLPDGKAVSGEVLRPIEAETVARRAVELHTAGIAWKDMALLLRYWSALDVYQSALARAGIPHYALQTAGLLDRREVMDLILALETVRDPNDDRALLGFLRSPFVGLTDDTLLSIACQVNAPYWTALDDVRTGEPELLQRGIELVEKYAALRDRLPAADLLENLLRESGYLAHLALRKGGGMQALANVRKVLRRIRAMPAATVAEVVRAFRQSKDLGIREGDAPLYGESDDVVTITTIHSAKGLEWNVVFWCDLLRVAGTAPREKFLLGRNEVMLGDPERSTREQSKAFRHLRDQLKNEDLAETKRLWYVAATRARDRLILPAIPQGSLKGRRSAAAAIKEMLPELEASDLTELPYRGVDGTRYVADLSYTPIPSPDELVTPPELDVAPPDALSPPPEPVVVPMGRSRHSATAFLSYARCPKKHWFKYVMGLREPEMDRSSDEFTSAVTRGLIVHDVLERLQEEDELDGLLEDAIGRWDPAAPPREGVPGRRYRAHLTGEIRSVAQHPEYRALADDPSARRELRFLYVGGKRAFAEGKIDLAAAPDETLVLLDVKTGRVAPERADQRADAYTAQSQVYIAATHEISELPVSRFAFQFSRAGVQISRPVTPTQLAQASEAFAATAAAIGAGAPRLTKYPHECRFCGYKRVGWCEGVKGGEQDDPPGTAGGERDRP